MEQQIESVMKRARGYWFVDGFTEIIVGVLFLVMDGALILREMTPQATFYIQIGTLFREIGLIKLVGFIAAVALLWVLKNRFTYRRTGFVREKISTWAQMGILLRNAVLIFLVPMMLFILAFIVLPAIRNILFLMPAWLPAFMGMLLAVIFYVAGRWMGLARFEGIGACMLLSGLGVAGWQVWEGLPVMPAAVLQSDDLLALPNVLQAPVADVFNRTLVAVGVLIFLWGVTFLISGLITFLRYRRENPAPGKVEA
jgi:hypothetical protein